MQTHDFCAVIDLSRVLRHTVVCSRCGVIEKYTTKELMKTELSWECELCAQSQDRRDLYVLGVGVTDDDDEVDDDWFECGIDVDEEDEEETDMFD